MTKTIVHITTVHPRYDTRIFHKMCKSLVEFGFNVVLLVADGIGDEIVDHIQIFDIGSFPSRKHRLINGSRLVYKKLRELSPHLLHFHDPELLPIATYLRSRGFSVIFDSHEDIPKQFLSKPYLNKPLRWVMSKFLNLYEWRVASSLDAVIGATPAITSKFLKFTSKAVNINNYPIIDENYVYTTSIKQDTISLCFIGYITPIRGLIEIVQALTLVKCPVRLKLAGSFSNKSFKDKVTALPGWSLVDFIGFVPRNQANKILQTSVDGLVTYHPNPNHLAAQPNKMFEYMDAGLPVIASDFPLWREIILGNQCGIVVNPSDPQAIADAIELIASNLDSAYKMGMNGKKAVRERYNWSTEANKLNQLYHEILQT